jgi:hypothetical protein
MLCASLDDTSLPIWKWVGGIVEEEAHGSVAARALQWGSIDTARAGIMVAGDQQVYRLWKGRAGWDARSAAPWLAIRHVASSRDAQVILP